MPPGVAVGRRSVSPDRHRVLLLAGAGSRPLVYVDTLMVQDVLADDEWVTALTDVNRRGLTPLFWTHVAPCVEVRLDMTSRLALGTTVRTG